MVVSKPGASRWWLTVRLRTVNHFTFQNDYPMPNLEKIKIGGIESLC